MSINNSIFTENNSKFRANCLSFVGKNLSIFSNFIFFLNIFPENLPDSFFSSNVAIYDAKEYYGYQSGLGTLAYVHMQPAGAIRAQAVNFTVLDCYFFNNTNFKGIKFYNKIIKVVIILNLTIYLLLKGEQFI